MNELQKMGHLMRRAGFGAGQAELEQRARKGVNGTIRELLDGVTAPDDPSADEMLDELVSQDRQQQLRPTMLKPWWLYKMTTTSQPLLEKMVLFWHGHFATSANKVNPPDLMLQQNRFFRENALGNWRTILQGISRDPAMIIWLDNNQNEKEHPNENYGREQMELFTLGIGNYTEQDVKQSGRSYTGWSQSGGNFQFIPARHDTGVKTFLGQSGNFDGDDIVNIILQQPAASEFMARKLFTFFAYDNPEPAVITSLARTFRDSDYSIRVLVEAIFHSRAFWSPRAVNTQIKSPAQLVVGTLRSLGVGQENSLDDQGVGPRRNGRGIWALASQSLKLMGQDLFYPPNVKGWDGGPAWINSATIMARINFINNLTAILAREGGEGFRTLVSAPTDFAGGIDPADEVEEDPSKLLHATLRNLGPLEVSPEARTTILTAVAGGPRGNLVQAAVRRPVRPAEKLMRLRTLVALAMQTPQYQLC